MTYVNTKVIKICWHCTGLIRFNSGVQRHQFMWVLAVWLCYYIKLLSRNFKFMPSVSMQQLALSKQWNLCLTVREEQLCAFARRDSQGNTANH